MTASANQRRTDRGVVHVDLSRLDGLLNLAGELVINRASLAALGRQARARFGFKSGVLDLLEAAEMVERLTEQIQERIIGSRMVPVGQVFERFHGLVASSTKRSDRLVDLRLSGETTEVDKKVIDELAEPLVHLVRNALDHGSQPVDARLRAGKPPRGTIGLTAQREGSWLIIDVDDDGAGVDLDAVRARALHKGVLDAAALAALDEAGLLQLLLRGDLSTAETVTGMSGRGVGLDAARRRIEMLGGTLTLTSTTGSGCRVRMRVPLTLAIVGALLVASGEETYAIPLEHIDEIIQLLPRDVRTVEGREVVEFRSEALALVRLQEVLDIPVEVAPRKLFVVVVKVGATRVGLVVGRVLWRQEIVIKPLSRWLPTTSGVSGASIAGDGSVFLILDVDTLCERGRSAQEREAVSA